MDKSQACTDSQDSPWFGLGGNHHLSPYSILCAWPLGLHPNVILFRNSQVGNPKKFGIEIFATLEAHNFVCKPPIEVRLKQSCKPYRNFYNSMWHATCMQVN